jgi:Tol biopolymer transport system component
MPGHRRSRVWAVTAVVATTLFAGGSAAWGGTDGLGTGGRDDVITYTMVNLHVDSELWIVTPDADGHAQLTHNKGNDFDPAWSPDGRLVAFSHVENNDVDIWVTRAGRPGNRNVTNNPNNPDLWPAWSPDGKRIAFGRQNFDGTSSLWVMEADGSNPTQLTDDTALNQHPAWSPDGSTIVFESSRDGNYELYRMDPDGSDVTRLTFTTDRQEENADFSPDGSLIAFDACEATIFCPGDANMDIFTMQPDGSDVVEVTTQDRIDANPSWSPDGSQIVFRSDRLTYTALWVMDADGSDPYVLTPLQGQGGVDPDWRPAA